MTLQRLRIGVQSWTLRSLSFEEAIRATADAGLHLIQLSSAHIDPREPERELLRKRRFMEAHGVSAHSFGVADPFLPGSEIRRLFEFARVLGLELLAVEPRDEAMLDRLEGLAVEFAIDVAIHNHGPGTPYAEPRNVRALLSGRDPRMGACLDSGWVTATGYDAADVFREYEGRVLDIHLKELRRAGRSEIADAAFGDGDANLAGLIDAARGAGFGGLLAIESDDELTNAADFVRSAAGFVARSMASGKG